MAEKIAHLHIKLSEKQLAALKREARKYKVTLSELMRAIADNIITNNKLNRAIKKEESK
jgi:hypothetical protein